MFTKIKVVKNEKIPEIGQLDLLTKDDVSILPRWFYELVFLEMYKFYEALLSPHKTWK